MFGMGFGEIVVIAVVAILVFGPERLPELARQAGRFVRTGRQMINKARDDLQRELGDDFEGLSEFANGDPRSSIQRALFNDSASPGAEHPAGPAQVGQPLGRDEVPPFDTEAT